MTGFMCPFATLRRAISRFQKFIDNYLDASSRDSLEPIEDVFISPESGLYVRVLRMHTQPSLRFYLFDEGIVPYDLLERVGN